MLSHNNYIWVSSKHVDESQLRLGGKASIDANVMFTPQAKLWRVRQKSIASALYGPATTIDTRSLIGISFLA
jgi:hypothetical protein